MPHDRLRTLSAVAIVVFTIWIVVATLSPGDSPAASTFGLNDLIGHFGLFAALGTAASLRFALSDAVRRAPRRALLMALLGFWVFAALTELAQGPIEGREPSLADWVADMAGALAGFFFGGALLRRLLEERRR